MWNLGRVSSYTKTKEQTKFLLHENPGAEPAVICLKMIRTSQKIPLESPAVSCLKEGEEKEKKKIKKNFISCISQCAESSPKSEGFVWNMHVPKTSCVTTGVYFTFPLLVLLFYKMGNIFFLSPYFISSVWVLVSLKKKSPLTAREKEWRLSNNNTET